MVYSNQEKYYDAITESSNKADSGLFIDFMLEEIINTLKKHQGEPIQDENGVKDGAKDGVKQPTEG